MRRLGSIRDQRVNVRIVAATHQPLEKLVGEGRFRLTFRLRIVELSVPPLRERGDDILLLAWHFLALHSARYRKAGPAFSPTPNGLCGPTHGRAMCGNCAMPQSKRPACRRPGD